MDIIRSSGYNGVLVIDGSAYAQNPDCKLFGYVDKCTIQVDYILFFSKRYHQVWSILSER